MMPIQLLQALAGHVQNLVGPPGHGVKQRGIDATQAEQDIATVLRRPQHHRLPVQRLTGTTEVVAIQRRAIVADQHHGIALRQAQCGNATHAFAQVASRLLNQRPIQPIGKCLQLRIRAVVQPQKPLTEPCSRKLQGALE
ncbi:hypothetical protein D3C72_1729400 [compost metagenome]